MSQRDSASSHSPRGGADRNPRPPRYASALARERRHAVRGEAVSGIAGKLRDHANDEHPE